MDGSEASFDAFVLSRGKSLLRFAYALTGDQALAEDLVQVALIKAHQRLGKGAIEQFEAYVRRIIVNTAVSWRRRLSSGEISGPVPDRPVSDAVDLLVQRDLVWRVLGELPRRQRVVLVLRYYEGLPDAEVASLLGCAPGTVRSLAARAFRALRGNPQLDHLAGPAALEREETR